MCTIHFDDSGQDGEERATQVDDALVDDQNVDFLNNITSVIWCHLYTNGWLGSRVVSVLDSGAEGPGFKSQPRRCRVTVLGKLFAPIVPLFTMQQNW